MVTNKEKCTSKFHQRQNKENLWTEKESAYSSHTYFEKSKFKVDKSTFDEFEKFEEFEEFVQSSSRFMTSLIEIVEAELTIFEVIIFWMRVLHRINKMNERNVSLAYRHLRIFFQQQDHQFLVLHFQVFIRFHQRQSFRSLILQFIFKLANANIRLRQSLAQLIRHDLSTIVRWLCAICDNLSVFMIATSLSQISNRTLSSIIHANKDEAIVTLSFFERAHDFLYSITKAFWELWICQRYRIADANQYISRDRDWDRDDENDIACKLSRHHEHMQNDQDTSCMIDFHKLFTC